MPPPVIRYAITDRHLLAADQRDRTAVPPAPNQPQTQAAAGPDSAQEIFPLDQSDRNTSAQRRDLHPPATTLELARLLRQAHHLRADGIDYLQLREKDLAPINLRALATDLRRALPPGSHPRLLLNLGHSQDQQANLATALAIAADGLHLPANPPADLPSEVRTAFARACRSTPILSVSAHTLAEVVAARSANLDLILFGPVFGKTVFGKTVFGKTVFGKTVFGATTDPQLVTPPTGLEALAAAALAAGPIPVLALGGVTLENTEACLAVGARGVAGIRLFSPRAIPQP